MKLTVQKREKKDIKKNDEIIGVVYGGEIENTSIVFKLADFEKAYQEVGTSGILELDIDGDIREVVIKDTQLNIASGDYYHIDFYAITRGQEMETDVNFEFINEVKAKGGMLNTSMNEVAIKALPKNLPKSIIIDLALLEEVGQSIKLADIKLPEGVAYVDGIDTEASVVSVIEAKSVADEEEANAGEVEITPDSSEEESTDNADTEDSKEEK